MRLIYVLLLFYVMPLMATIYKEIDTTQPLNCNFSYTYHNRILLDAGRIKKVIYPEDKLIVHMEEMSGQAFVQAKDSRASKTIISVVTQDGQVQDLILDFTSDLGEIVVLIEPLEFEKPKEEPTCEQSSLEGLDQTIAMIMQGEIPKGYFALQSPQKVVRRSMGICARLVGELKGCDEDLKIIEIQNKGFWRKRICEEQFSCNNVLWIYFDKHCLKAREKMTAIIAVKP